MAELSGVGGVARPYANALFEFAQGKGESLAEWNHALDLLATIASDPNLRALIGDPRTTAAQLHDTICATAAKANKVAVNKLYPPFVNLIKLLIQNGRLHAAPEIARLFAVRRASAESTIAAEMTTAVEMDSAQQEKFIAALKKSTLGQGREVQLTFAVDPTLIGGAVVRAGDHVLDGSVRAQLAQLSGAIRA